MKKRLYVFVIASALVAAAPAIARAVAPEREPAIVQGTPHAHGHEVPAAGEEREEHAPKPINWFDFSNKEQPPYGGMLINFVLLMAMYYSLGRKPVGEALRTRRVTIAKDIEEAQKMRHEAEERAVKYQEKLKHLEVELKETREALRSAGEADRDRIVREAEEKAARMERDARFLVEQEMKQMRGELTREAIEMAVVAAEELLKKRITASDQERLAEDYLAELSAKRPSGAQEPRASAAPGGE
jgi:F-type H+-transporting ATPase subunit b